MSINEKKISDWEILTPSGWSNFNSIKVIQKKCFIKIQFDDGTNLECSENHRVKIISEVFKYAKDLKRGDICIGKGGINKTIISKKKINRNVNLYDLINVEKNQEFYSNDIISHNCAFIEKAEEIWTAAFPTLSTGGRAILLSTPCGVGNFFHKMWIQAENEENKFIPIKLPWYLHPERDDNWRKEQDRISDNLKKTAQECDAEFLSSGTNVVDLTLIDWYEKTFMKDPIEKRGMGGEFWLWQYPDYTQTYIICADVSRGDGLDYSACHVLNAETMEQCAEYKGHIPTKDFGNLLVSIATEYNNGLLIVEREGVGWATLQQIIDRGYPNTFYGSSDLKYVDVEKQITNKYNAEDKKLIPGFATTTRTRPIIIDHLSKYFMEKAITIFSRRTYSELKVFIWENGKAQAAKGYNDDLLMSLAIGIWVRDTALRLKQEGIALTKSFLNKFSVSKSDVQPVYRSHENFAKNTWQIPVNTPRFGKSQGEDITWLL
jgi:hypothetical protein